MIINNDTLTFINRNQTNFRFGKEPKTKQYVLCIFVKF